MWKKLCASIIALSVVSAFFMPITQAASPLTFPGNTTVMFEQKFDGTSTADFPEFNISNSGSAVWQFAPGYISLPYETRNASIMTKSVYDLKNASKVEFNYETIVTSNGYTIYLGDYRLHYHNTPKKMFFYHKDSTFNRNDETTYLAAGTIDAYDQYATYKVLYDGDAVTVTREDEYREKTIISYEVPEGTTLDFSGKYGIRAEYAGSLSVFYMSLIKSDSAVTTNQWRYDTNFKAGDTVTKYTAEGLTLPSSTTFVNYSNSSNPFKGYAKMGSNAKYSLTPAGQNPSGDYAVEFCFSPANANPYSLYFNYIDSKNYYEVLHYRKALSTAIEGYPANMGIVLRKYVGGERTDLAMKDVNGTLFGDSTVPYLYTIKIKDNGTSNDISVVVDRLETSQDTPIEFNVTDAAPFENDGKVYVSQWGYTGAGSKLFSLSAYSLMDETEQETVTYAETVVDKSEFLNADLNSLSGLNITTSNNTTTLTKNNGEGLKLSNTSSKEFSMYYNDVLSGSYDFETTIQRDNNHGYVDFNRNGNEFYRVYFKGNSAPYTISLQKRTLVNGTATTTDFADTTAKYTGDFAEIGRSYPANLKVSVRPNTSGDVSISAEIKVNGKTINLSATDTAAAPLNGGSAYKSGNIRIVQGYCKNASVNEFGITKYVTEVGAAGDKPEFMGRFYCDDSAVKEIANGNIYFAYPTSMIINHKVVAALYENNEMTAVKTFDPVELYSGKVKLFDTTNADIDNTSVKVYFFDAEDTLNKLTEVYELN